MPVIGGAYDGAGEGFYGFFTTFGGGECRST